MHPKANMKMLAPVENTPFSDRSTPPGSGPSLGHHGDMPNVNPYLRSPMPSSLVSSGDSLRQFYRGGIPQYRIIPPLKLGTPGVNNT